MDCRYIEALRKFSPEAQTRMSIVLGGVVNCPFCRVQHVFKPKEEKQDAKPQ